jgi:hypothetical protein
MPGWAVETLAKDELDYAPPGAEPFKEEPIATSQELLERYDKNVLAAREALAGASDEQFMANWTDPVVCDEPQRPPSRPAWRLSAAQRHSRTASVRSDGG